MSDEFEQAAAFAASEVKQWLAADPGVRQGPLEHLLWWRFGCEYRDGPRDQYIALYGDCIPVLFSMAKSYADAHRLLSRIVSSKLRAGVALSDEEGLFAGMALEGLWPVPGRDRAGKPVMNHERDVLIVSLVQELVGRFGITRSRNDASSGNLSAFDLVSAAFAASGRHEVTYSAIRDVWFKKDFRRKYDELAKAVSTELAARAERTTFNALAPDFKR